MTTETAPQLTARVLTQAHSVTMPAGAYWLGDPCYAVEEQDRWVRWLNDSYANAGLDGNDRDALLALMGAPTSGGTPRWALGFATHSGDGSYDGSDGNLYPVDAGLIGLVPVEVASPNRRGDLSVLVEFKDPFVCTRTDLRDAAVLMFGHIRIVT